MHTTTRRSLLAVLGAAPVLLALPRPARASDPAALSEQALDAAFAEHGPPAIAAAAVGPGGVIWSGVRGVRRVGGDDATLSDAWHIGSNSKAMTAVLYARLVETGVTRWDLPMGELFPELSMHPEAAAITIDDLLCHQGGILEDVWSREKSAAYQADERPVTVQRLELLGQTLAGPPGGPKGTFAYANANYLLAAAVVERLTGRPWEEVIKAELFDPLSMNSVGHALPQGDNPWGHRVVGPGVRGAVDPARSRDGPSILTPAGRLHMTVADYARFLQLYLTDGGTLLSPGTMRRITSQRPGEGRAATYGWAVAESGALAHEGSNGSWHIAAEIAPDRSCAAFSVTNQMAPVEAGNRTLTRRLLEIQAT